MDTKTIKINEQEYIVKQSFRSLMEFEKITKKPAGEINVTINDMVTLLYCVLKSCNKETFKYTLDEFIDVLDDNGEAITDFSNYLLEQQGAGEVNKDGKKKKTK